MIGAIFIIVVGLTYLEWRRKTAAARGEGYGTSLLNEPERVDTTDLPNPILAISPLILVGVANFALTRLIPQWYGAQYTVDPQVIPGAQAALSVATKGVVAIWAVQGALLLGILLVLLTAFRRVYERFAAGTKTAVSGALLATLNTASEYGFGGVIAALPGFIVVSDALKSIPNPLVNAAVSVSTLAGITGSASGMSIALAPCPTPSSRRPSTCRSAGSPAPRGRHGQRRHGHAAAQRRGHHAAGRHRPVAPRILSRHFRGDPDQDAGRVRGHRRLT